MTDAGAFTVAESVNVVEPTGPPAPGVVLIEHDWNGTGRAKSLRTDVIDCDDRVCGRNVAMQPLKPKSLRLSPPSMNAFVRSVAVGVPSARRHSQPPQLVGVELFTEKVICDPLGDRMYFAFGKAPE